MQFISGIIDNVSALITQYTATAEPTATPIEPTESSPAVQTEEEQQHAKGQLEIFQNSLTPAQVSLGKIEAPKAISIEQTEKIHALLAKLIIEIGKNQDFFVSIEKMNTCPDSIPMVKKWLEQEEGRLSPENKALFNHITSEAIPLLKKDFGQVNAPFLKLPNVDDTMTVAIKRTLITSKAIEPCATAISEINSQYLKNLVPLEEVIKEPSQINLSKAAARNFYEGPLTPLANQ